jgi:membrane protein implicated in regulation of membrane protease activity
MLPPLPLLWLILAGLLLLLVLLGIDTDGLLTVGGIVALVMVLVASLPVLPGPAQGILFLALVTVGYVLLRRWSERGGDSPAPSPRAELAEVIGGFDADGEGRVRWQGQSWAAQNLEPGRPLPPGSRVVVLGREGTHLQVLPRPPAKG